MLEFLRDHQLNLMLVLGSACVIIAFFVGITRTLPKTRKRILMIMEISAAILLFSDRLAYIYRGDTRALGYYMVRICNYLVFAMTLLVVHTVTLYLADMLLNEAGLSGIPVRLTLASGLFIVGEILLFVSQFTGMYYTFDETNHYQRAPLFIICYIIPILIFVLQLTAIIHYYDRVSKRIRLALVLFTIIPGVASILQFFLYGLSLINISIVGMVIVLYVFVLNDSNETVERAHEIELQNMVGEKARMQKLFDQTATAFVSAVEKKDEFAKGNAVRIAEYAKRVAEMGGKDAEECEQVYYAALLHDVGLIGIPDSVIKNDTVPGKWDSEIMRKKPLIGNEILSSISEYPYLCVGAHYSHERYNGTGYPEGLKGEEIPEIARIIAVADAYVTMVTKKRYREARPDFVAREAFVKGRGAEFDPKYADIMIKILDMDSGDGAGKELEEIEAQITCGEYRDHISNGIPVEADVSQVTFECAPLSDGEAHEFSAPSIILFDSYDKRVHDNERAIREYGYLEYGEFWFDDHSIQAAARKIEEKITRRQAESHSEEESPVYKILAGRYEDHLKLKMQSPSFEKEITVALPSGSKAASIALTGEYCQIRNIATKKTGKTLGPDDIPRIADAISYIDRIESDVRNIQIDRTRSSSTDGIELKDRLVIEFHTMSLPGANLVWHCPYFVIFHSDDGIIGGPNYQEYGLVKLYGENDGNKEDADNHIDVVRTDEFPGWEGWKEINKEGMECKATFVRKRNRIILKTRNLGIEMENTTILKDDPGKVYVALTGDQIALTDIRIRY